MSRPHVSFETQGVRYESHLSDDTPVNDHRNASESIDYFTSDGSVDGSAEETMHGGQRKRRASLSIRMPPPQSQAGLAFTALQYLPMPVIVLSSTKHIVLANEAVGRLLGIDLDEAAPNDEAEPQSEEPDVDSTADLLQGKTLGELGIDLLQGGNAVFVSWEDVLQNVVDDAAKAQKAYKKHCGDIAQEKEDEALGVETRKRSLSIASSRYSQSGVKKTTEVHDAAVDIVFSTIRDPLTGLPKPSSDSVSDLTDAHMQSKMIISVWATEDEQFFTLTFTATADVEAGKGSTFSGTASHSGSTTELSKTTSRIVSRRNAPLNSGHPSTVSSNSSSASDPHGRGHRSRSSPASTPNMPSPITFPPRGPPDKSASAAAPSIFTKSNRLKDAILNSMRFPAYDSSFGVPNKAAIQLIYPYADAVLDTNESATDFLSRYVLYREDFVDQIPLQDIPIMRLMREQKRFEGYRVGMYSAKDGSRLLYDVAGEPMLDEKGVFIGGLVVFYDVTGFQNEINEQKERNERQFEDITNMIPQMIWRTTPTGEHDYYSQRWYDYTGLTVEQSAGEGWLKGFHPDDLALAQPIWAHSLATGDEYLVEYRARSAAGDWRWMLGRAVPMRDEHGAIMKWFGTCTDIHDLVLAREEAKQTRAQLERVIEHARITLWAVDMDRNLSLFEGQPMYEPSPEQLQRKKQDFIGVSIWDIFREQGRDNELQRYRKPMESILTGKTTDETIEVDVSSTGRWFRTRLVPLLRRDRAGGVEGKQFIDGLVGVSMDITEVKSAERDLQRRNQENAHLLAQSVAAKEASKMKSQFLANMSHEIRTPIAGVIGMADLLLDESDIGKLTKEQRECAENIQRSANGLLTVINDILDFSKVESGRLDIEEVQFDLSVVINDVNRMLSFAAERKGLTYIDDIPELKNWKVMGDPGRLRQVITNLLTNSIKFTSEGSVTISMTIEKETNEILEVTFTVQDTGIGIEEEVRRRLFKPFSQADSSTARRFGGTGLGLTISKNLVELMHGRISLESILGAGTKASFTIPFHKAPYQSGGPPLIGLDAIPDRLASDLSVSRTSSESGPATPTHSRKLLPNGDPSIIGSSGLSLSAESVACDLSIAERKLVNVLVVEDNPINQQIAIKTIRKLGFPVTAVWNGQEALDYLRSPSGDRPAPDIILMDVQGEQFWADMPVMDGYRATYKIRNAKEFASNPRIQGTPIVAMTASAIQGDREKCQMSGMDDYLAKPVKKPNLERMLVSWALKGRQKREELLRDSSKLLRPTTSRAPSSFETNVSSVESPQDHLISELDRLEYTQRNVLERSSETADVVAMRKQNAEEKAMSLRDDMLIRSADNPRHQLGRAESSVSIEKDGADETSHSLTSENMQKMYGIDQRPGNNDPNRMSMDVDNASSLAVEPSNPPPPLSSASITTTPTARPVKRSPLGHQGPD